MSSIKELHSKMNQRGISYADTGAQPNSLSGLKTVLDGMYKARQGLSGTYKPGVQSTTNIGPKHKSYTEFQGSIGSSANAMSIGDYNRAVDGMASCTCDARSSSSCSCVSVSSGNYCSCNARSAYSCDCVSRSGGKYGGACDCNSVYVGCSCESRSASYTCSCDSRCSCNSVREFR